VRVCARARACGRACVLEDAYTREHVSTYMRVYVLSLVLLLLCCILTFRGCVLCLLSCVRLVSPRRMELKEQNSEMKQLRKLVFQLAASQAYTK